MKERLEADGHTFDGRCDLCWRIAGTLYAGGQGAYESHTEAYHEVLRRVDHRAEPHAPEGAKEG